MNLSINHAAEVLLGGGVIAYPTEGVFGLGCMPDDIDAVMRLLDIKQRELDKGLILVAGKREQLEGWIRSEDLARMPEINPAMPVTWIAQPGPKVLPIIRGSNAGVAVRLTGNPVAAAICDACDSPITSTSANIAGRPVVRNKIALRRSFGDLVDYIAPGNCGPASGPSEIRVLEDGRILRPKTT